MLRKIALEIQDFHDATTQQIQLEIEEIKEDIENKRKRSKQTT